MKAICTYLIQLRGQVEWGDTTATLFTTATDQSGLIRLMRHLHRQGFVFLALNCK